MKHHLALGLLLIFDIATATAGVVKIGPNQFAVRLRAMDGHPATSAAARRTLQQIGVAAAIACGATDQSLSEVRRAVRKSACWQASMDDAVHQIDHPLLSQAWQERR